MEDGRKAKQSKERNTATWLALERKNRTNFALSFHPSTKCLLCLLSFLIIIQNVAYISFLVETLSESKLIYKSWIAFDTLCTHTNVYKNILNCVGNMKKNSVYAIQVNFHNLPSRYDFIAMKMFGIGSVPQNYDHKYNTSTAKASLSLHYSLF